MRFHIVFVVSIVLFSLSFLPTSARFFPNISSLPPGLLPNATKIAWDSFHKFAGCRAGDKKDGLSNLKKYFNEFGYIPNSPANFSDEFDDALESALKTYQKNFNLNETGQLDNATLQQIQRPRCGNADIVNGTSTMNSGKTAPYNTTTTAHFHTVGHYTFFPGEPRWPSDQRDLTYSFLPSNGLTDDVKAVFSRAFDRWSTVIPLNFTQTDSFNSADIKIGFFVGDHGDGEPFDGVLGTLAHAFSPPSGRFHLDGDENWVVSGDISKSSGSTAIDLESVAVHEIGHLLGLGHSSIEDAIMYPTISTGTRKVELASDDIEGIQVLYGSNPNYNGSSTTSTQERESSGGTRIVVSLWGLFVSMAVGLVVLLVL